VVAVLDLCKVHVKVRREGIDNELNQKMNSKQKDNNRLWTGGEGRVFRLYHKMDAIVVVTAAALLQ